jgi:hypothetical protein
MMYEQSLVDAVLDAIWANFEVTVPPTRADLSLRGQQSDGLRESALPYRRAGAVVEVVELESAMVESINLLFQRGAE